MKGTMLITCCLMASLLFFAQEYVPLAYRYRLNKGDLLEVHLFVSDGFDIQMERPLQKGITIQEQEEGLWSAYELAGRYM